jgi:hypothetical protein
MTHVFFDKKYTNQQLTDSVILFNIACSSFQQDGSMTEIHDINNAVSFHSNGNKISAELGIFVIMMYEFQTMLIEENDWLKYGVFIIDVINHYYENNTFNVNQRKLTIEYGFRKSMSLYWNDQKRFSIAYDVYNFLMNDERCANEHYFDVGYLALFNSNNEGLVGDFRGLTKKDVYDFI